MCRSQYPLPSYLISCLPIPPTSAPFNVDDSAAPSKEESKKLRTRVWGLVWHHIWWLIFGLLGAALVILSVSPSPPCISITSLYFNHLPLSQSPPSPLPSYLSTSPLPSGITSLILVSITYHPHSLRSVLHSLYGVYSWPLWKISSTILMCSC